MIGAALTIIDDAAAPSDGTAFDYSALSSEAATEVRGLKVRIERHHRQTVESIIAAGADLNRVRDVIGHGNFGPWLAAEFGWTDRTAQNYMRAATVFGTNPKCVSVLPVATVYKLAAPSTPENVRGELLAKLEHGEPVNPREIEGEIAQARHDAKQAAAEAKLTNGQRRARANRAAKHKRERDEHEAQRQAAIARAEVVARELIAEIGAAPVARIVQAINDWDVADALRKAVASIAEEDRQR